MKILFEYPIPMILQLFILLLISAGCNKTYDLDACNELSMKRFRGFVDAKKKFDDNCTGLDVKYTQELCQEAFNGLLFKHDLNLVKNKYGDKVVGCFNEDDLKKYQSPKN
jgi:hypothetical protein